MQEILEFGTRAGPKTVITLFSYGGVHKNTNGNLIDEMAKASYVAGRVDRTNETLAAQGMPALARSWPVMFAASPEDALISRSRSVAAQRFLQQSDAEVLIMLDHDLWWVPPSKDYEGDLLHLARQCSETRGIVGAAVSKKVRGQGIASMPKRDGEFRFGCEPILEPAWFIGAAFTAYHREALQRVSDEGYLLGKHFSEQLMVDCAPGFKPLFMELVVKHPHDDKLWLHLSEDWAFCHRARELGIESYISCKPMVVHFGEYGFQVVRDAQPDQTPQPAPAQQHYEGMPKGRKAISCLHATRGRPRQATEAVKRWAELAADKSQIEYIVSVDEDDSSMVDWTPPDVGFPVTVVVGQSRGNVDAYNRAYHKSTGKVLLQVHDDVTPPQNWDKAVSEAIGDADKPVALHVSDGLPASVNRNPKLMTVAVVTRAFAEKLGGLFHPEYVSIACDNDLSEFADAHGYRKDARGLLFKHDWNGADRDETQKRSYQVRNWEWGKNVLQRRVAAGFPEVAA